MKSIMKSTCIAVFCASLLLMSAASASASPFSFSFIVNTTPLIGNANAPFYLDFQLTDGSGTGDGNNTVTVSNFDFGPGGAAGPAGSIGSFGGAGGSLSSSVALTDSSFVNEFFQQFLPGSQLRFTVSGSSNVEGGPTPDAFAFSILDMNLFNIPTTGIGDSLVFFSLNKPTLTFGDIRTGVSIDPAGVTATAVPEPASLTLLATGLLGVSRWCRRQRRPNGAVRNAA